jgi:hypothetical protein
MKKIIALSLLMLTIAGCAKTGRAWVMNDSPYWDMLYEGWGFHVLGIAGAIVAWVLLKKNWRFQDTWLPLIVAAFSILLFSGIGLTKGYDYIHTMCGWEKKAADCPSYKSREGWDLHPPSGK